MTKLKASSFIDLLDLEIIDPNRTPSDSASATIEIGEQHGQHNDVLHGGVLYSLADTLGGYLIWKNIDLGKLVTTIEMKINYLSPVPIKGTAKANAKIKHLGKRTGVVIIDLFHVNENSEKLVATALGTYQIISNS